MRIIHRQYTYIMTAQEMVSCGMMIIALSPRGEQYPMNSAPPDSGVIGLRIATLRQLFDDMDPSPLPERDLPPGPRITS